MKGFSIVVAAASSNFGIGRKGDLPWRIREDMAYFKKITSDVVISDHGITIPTSSPASKSTIASTSAATGTATTNMNAVTATKMNAVIMGRKTYESIPRKFRPLDNRLNVILTKNDNIGDCIDLKTNANNILIANSFEEALKILSSSEYSDIIHDIFVIGGGTVYAEALLSPYCSKIYLTEVMSEFSDVDTFFPSISASKFILTRRSHIHKDSNHSYRFIEYSRIPQDVSYDFTNEYISHTTNHYDTTINYEEVQYLDLIRNIITNGVHRGDRTGTGTLSKFGVQMRFSLRNNTFPLLTTKKVFWRGVAEELLWFVRGSTNGNLLSDKNIHIWDGNGSREFLDSRGLHHREVGDLGPVYGFQWRHFGAEYVDMHTDYTGQGVDQLIDCINKLKKTPEDRRIIMSAWNPSDLDKMALPPCHMFCQFYVANGELSCLMYQRSADMGLGVPFNIASYSLLTAMMAQVCGLKCGDFVHSIGDAHVYGKNILQYA